MTNLPQFRIHEFVHIDFPFLPEELEQLTTYGAIASALAKGLIAPVNEKQIYFVSLCRGEVKPKTSFHLLWIRYSCLVMADNKISLFQGMHDEQKHIADTLRKEIFTEIEKGKAAVAFEHELQLKLRKKIVEYEKQLGIYKEPVIENWERHEISGNDWREQD